MVMLAEGEYNPSQGTSSKNDEKDQNHYVPPEMEPAVFSTSGSIHNIQHAEVKLGAFIQRGVRFVKIRMRWSVFSLSRPKKSIISSSEATLLDRQPLGARLPVPNRLHEVFSFSKVGQNSYQISSIM